MSYVAITDTLGLLGKGFLASLKRKPRAGLIPNFKSFF